MSTDAGADSSPPAGTASNIIEIRNLRKIYEGGDVVAVNSVDLDIHEGEFFTILGPSGSGKSTLLQMITGIETPTSGDIYIAGKRVNDVKPYDRDTSLVFQEYALFPHMTARENVAYGLMLRGVDESERDDRVQTMFELMDLEGKEDRRVGDLSGGERQRVATARSLVIEPDVLLLDEVLGSLDEKLAKEMQVELKRIQEEVGKTFVFVTHSQEEAFSMSDRIAIMNNGDVVQVGEPLEIYQNPASEFIADFLGMPNIVRGTVESVENETVVVESEGVSYHVGMPSDTDEPSTGDVVSFFVPNEQFRFQDDTENQFRVTVTDTIFKGSYTEYALRLENGREFRAHQTTGDILVAEDSEVTAGFLADAAKLFV